MSVRKRILRISGRWDKAAHGGIVRGRGGPPWRGNDSAFTRGRLSLKSQWCPIQIKRGQWTTKLGQRLCILLNKITFLYTLTVSNPLLSETNNWEKKMSFAWLGSHFAFLVKFHVQINFMKLLEFLPHFKMTQWAITLPPFFSNHQHGRTSSTLYIWSFSGLSQVHVPCINRETNR